MKRRKFIALLGTAAVAQPLAARAQGKPVPVIGILLSQPGHPLVAGMLAELRALGYETDRNLRVVIRSADMQLERLPQLATELVELQPDVIVSFDTPPTRAAVDATKNIPIVLWAGDPVGSGFVTNISRPGGNVTGISNFAGELSAKRLQIAKEMVTTAKRFGVLFNSRDPVTTPQVRETERAAQVIGVELRFLPVTSDEELETALNEAVHWSADALLWLGGQERIFVDRTIGFAAQQRLALIVPRREQVEAGALLCYYPVQTELARRLATQVDKILKGTNPGDLPVEAPTRFELVINMKTARTLGLTIPPALLARADEIIE